LPKPQHGLSNRSRHNPCAHPQLSLPLLRSTQGRTCSRESPSHTSTLRLCEAKKAAKAMCASYAAELGLCPGDSRPLLPSTMCFTTTPARKVQLMVRTGVWVCEAGQHSAASWHALLPKCTMAWSMQRASTSLNTASLGTPGPPAPLFVGLLVTRTRVASAAAGVAAAGGNTPSRPMVTGAEVVGLGCACGKVEGEREGG